MSYILNALRKSEQERLAKQNPITPNSFLETNEQQQQTTHWPKIIAILVIINLIALGYLFLRESAPETVAIAEPARDPAVAKTQPSVPENKQKTPMKAKPLAKTVQPPKPKTVVAAPKKTQPKPRPSVQTAAKASQPKSPKTVAKPVEKPTPAPTRVIAAVKQPPIQPPAKPVKPEKAKITANKPTAVIAKPTPKPIASQPANQAPTIPWLNELPYQFRRTVPKISINVFVHHDDPENSFVIIDMTKYRVGQTLPNTLKIKEIRPDSVVFEFNNKIFRIKRP